MGDPNAEPSMEDILASIKRIIADEDAPRSLRDDEDVERLESEDVEDEAGPEREPVSDPVVAAPEPVACPEPEVETILSSETAQASRAALDALSRLVVKPGVPSDTTLESLVRDMLRPMLREWIDAKLPGVVETMVGREIARITGERG